MTRSILLLRADPTNATETDIKAGGVARKIWTAAL